MGFVKVSKPFLSIEKKYQMVYKPGSVPVITGDDHSSGMDVAVHLMRPTRAAMRTLMSLPLFGLAPGGVYPATIVTDSAVCSYHTLSPLPVTAGGLLSVALSLGSPPPGVTRHRVSVEPGLSSFCRVSPNVKSGHPTIWQNTHEGRSNSSQEHF
tara:strand:+ start:9548 stop:10009 length:462 start_codon:yes stop_codon:yes gene_type:complete